MIIVGIDPGMGGGLGVLNERAQFLAAFPMPVRARNEDKDEVDAGGVAALLERISTAFPVAGDAGITMVVMERQAAMPSFGFGDKCPACKRGKTIQTPQVSFTIGDGFGILKGVCAGLGIGVTFVTPQTWKKYYGLPGGRDSKPLSRTKAIDLYPMAPLPRKKDEGVAEAILIGRWWVMKELVKGQ